MELMIRLQSLMIIPQKFSRKQFKDESIEHAIKFILSEDHVRTLSWGSMDKVISPNETIVLPKLHRLTTRKIMWESYMEYFKTDEKKRNLELVELFSICCVKNLLHLTKLLFHLWTMFKHYF